MSDRGLLRASLAANLVVLALVAVSLARPTPEPELATDYSSELSRVESAVSAIEDAMGRMSIKVDEVSDAVQVGDSFGTTSVGSAAESILEALGDLSRRVDAIDSAVSRICRETGGPFAIGC